MECFYLSQPEERGYIKRMHQIWTDRKLFDISEQRIADQVRVIRRLELLSSSELEEIRNRVLGVASAAELGNQQTEEVLREKSVQINGEEDRTRIQQENRVYSNVLLKDVHVENHSDTQKNVKVEIKTG